MERQESIRVIRDACKQMALELMKAQPAVRRLGDKETEDELYKVLFEMTQRVEAVKKRLAKLESRDDSTLV